jgi:5-methylcytosine-specific restriction enzyme A
MSRKEFTRKTMEAAFARCGGQCQGCGAKLFPGKYAYDHILPDQLGGEPTLENCQVLCTNCHSAKTFKTDIPKIRKSDRQRDKHIGAFKRSPRPLGKGNNQRSATRPIIRKSERLSHDK